MGQFSNEVLNVARSLVGRSTASGQVTFSLCSYTLQFLFIPYLACRLVSFQVIIRQRIMRQTPYVYGSFKLVRTMLLPVYEIPLYNGYLAVIILAMCQGLSLAFSKIRQVSSLLHH
jgi:hypothetical protein